MAASASCRCFRFSAKAPSRAWTFWAAVPVTPWKTVTLNPWGRRISRAFSSSARWETRRQQRCCLSALIS